MAAEAVFLTSNDALRRDSVRRAAPQTFGKIVPPRILILADDLTGAADGAAAFLGRAARVAVALRLDALPRAEVLAIDLDTRWQSERTARRIVRRAFASGRAKRADILFKKIDSTLRGHVAAELAAARAALGRGRAILFAPAFPGQGRVVRNGRVYVDGVALRGETCDQLSATGLVIHDAATDADLDAIARVGLAMRPRPLFAGSAGLARALARTLPVRRKNAAARAPRTPVVTVIGSASPVSVRQARTLEQRTDAVTVSLRPETLLASRSRGAARALERALSEGRDAIVKLEWARAPDPADKPVSRALGRFAARHARRAALVLTGGETARAVLDARGVRTFRLLGEVESGVPIGKARRGELLCTKAGAFGGPETLAKCVLRLRREMK